MADHLSTDVLVVGGGPVGMIAALSLAEHGIRTRVVDMYQRTALQSYGLVLHPESLRLLDRLGLAEQLIERGNRIDRIRIYHGAEPVGELDMTRLDGPFPFALVISQAWLERALELQLKKKGVEILWNHSALAFDARDGGVATIVAHKAVDSLPRPEVRGGRVEMETFRIHSEFLIGADGYYSLVRKALKADYSKIGPSESFCVFEFQTSDSLGHEAVLILDDEGANVMWPLADNRGRWSFQVHEQPPGCPGRADLQRLVEARAPWVPWNHGEIHWATSVRFERRLVDRLSSDQIVLAGDAAHLTGPIGVQSMNLGMREVYHLAGRFDALLCREETPETLRHYDGERREEWRKLLDPEHRMIAGAGAPYWAEQLAPRLLPCLPASGADLDSLLGQIGLALR